MVRIHTGILIATIVALAAGASLRRSPSHKNASQAVAQKVANNLSAQNISTKDIATKGVNNAKNITKAVNKTNLLTNSTHVAAAMQSDAEKVAALRTKLQQVQKGLTAIFAKNEGLSHSDVAKLMSKFTAELDQVLKSTKNSTSKETLHKLQNAQAGVHALVKDITKQQVRLMRENEAQEASLLVGVLMTRQQEPMKNQMEVLNNPDFKKLQVVQAVLKANDTKTPLYQQVAAQLDKTNVNSTASTNATAHASKAAVTITSIVKSLEGRVHQMEKAEQRREKVHATEMKDLDKKANMKDKNSTKSAHHAVMLKRILHRKFQKESAIAKKDIQSLKNAVKAIKTGDMSALHRAQQALEESIKSMQSQGAGFLYLIQVVHQAEGKDCPYCAAQCVEKCHSNGSSYTTCLTECADAGK